MKLKIVLIEDEKILRISLRDNLQNAGYSIEAFENPIDSIEYLKTNKANVVISDIKLPQLSGLEVLKIVKEFNNNLYVIMMTAYGSIETAVEAMKKGAYDFLNKPFRMDELLFKLKRIEEIESIKIQKSNLEEKIESVVNTSKFIGISNSAKTILNNIDLVKNSNTNILITGETSTGKELIANIIHNTSNRKDKPFVKVSCAILSREVFESELFGHAKGSFTGAFKDRIGRFEQANKGTIYLDDIDDVPLDLQVKLLRVLQEREFERVGDNESIKIDIRCVASTKANLLQLVKEGKFREDLYYRLNVFPIHIPPLRERKEDIAFVAEYFFEHFSPLNKIKIDESLMTELKNYYWPGNVRELKNIIERLCLISQVKKLDKSVLPNEILQNKDEKDLFDINNNSYEELLTNFETELINKALTLANGNKSKAAEILKIPISTLRSKMEKLHIF